MPRASAPVRASGPSPAGLPPAGPWAETAVVSPVDPVDAGADVVEPPVTGAVEDPVDGSVPDSTDAPSEGSGVGVACTSAEMRGSSSVSMPERQRLSSVSLYQFEPSDTGVQDALKGTSTSLSSMRTTAIYSYEGVLRVMPGTTFAILIGVLIGFPISVTNILPGAAFADLTQYDTIMTGVNRAGMFYASRNFITSLSQSVVMFATPALIAIGSTTGQATVFGVRLTAGVAAVTIAVALVLYVFYDDRHVTSTIDEFNRTRSGEGADTVPADL